MTPAQRRAVILLEAIISLIVIAGVAGACLSLRSRAIAQRVAVQEAIATQQAIDAILAMATSNLLEGAPITEINDEGASRSVWTGQLHGEPYRVVAEMVSAPNPFADARVDAPAMTTLRQWTIEFRDERVRELRMAASR